MDAEAPTAICVLGMSRCGTSLTARLLLRMGVYLGPREELLTKELRQLRGEGEAVMTRAREANPEGFFEHYRMTRLNDRILRVLGGNWREPPSLPAGWELSDDLAAEREEGHGLIAQSFAGHSLWGWKDPRNCLTLPFWRSLVPGMRYLICLRNPIDAARSLQRRDGLPLEQGLALWSTYVAWALVNTSGGIRIFVRYEDYFENLEATVGKIARFTGADAGLGGREARQLAAGAVNARLWRNRTSREQLVEDRGLPPEVSPLFLLTELLASQDGAADTAGLHAAVDRYARRLLESTGAVDAAAG